jgi:hypothetical protein
MGPIHSPQPQGHVTFKFGGSEFYIPEPPSISAGQLVFRCGAHATDPFWKELSAWVRGKSLPADCSFHVYKYTNEELLRHEVKKGAIAAVSFPALDAASTDAAWMTITLQSASITAVKGTGKANVAVPIGQLLWRRRDFRLFVDGCSTLKVSSIDAISATTSGGFPNLHFLISQTELQGFNALKQSGKSPTGKIVFLQPNLQKAVFTLQFDAKVVAILNLSGSYPTPGGRVATATSIAKAKVEMSMGNIFLTKG